MFFSVLYNICICHLFANKEEFTYILFNTKPPALSHKAAVDKPIETTDLRAE